MCGTTIMLERPRMGARGNTATVGIGWGAVAAGTTRRRYAAAQLASN